VRFLSWKYNLSLNGNGAVVTLASVFLAVVVVAQDSPSRPFPEDHQSRTQSLDKSGSMLIDSVTSENGEGVVALWSESVVASWIANDKS
jgi:hypothetical protein